MDEKCDKNWNKNGKCWNHKGIVDKTIEFKKQSFRVVGAQEALLIENRGLDAILLLPFNSLQNKAELLTEII